MVKRIVAIVFIFCAAAAAWGILGATIFSRTRSSRSMLSGQVASSWGAPQEQAPPSAHYEETMPRKVTTVVDGKKTERISEERVTRALALDASRLEVRLDLEHRQKGLLWYSTYKVAFAGVYTFRGPSQGWTKMPQETEQERYERFRRKWDEDLGVTREPPKMPGLVKKAEGLAEGTTGMKRLALQREQRVTFTFPYPAEKAIYDDLQVSVDGQPLALASQAKGVSGTAQVTAGKAVAVRVGYRSQGLESWRYRFGGEVSQVRDFALRVATNFRDIDFPENTLSPSQKRQTARGWELDWNYKSLISGFQVGIAMPQKLQPGPLAGEISLFAPVSLFFFFFVMFILTTLRGIELHPMNYFFLAAAFFAFHLLLAYLVDHVSIHTAFVVCSLVSMFLVVSYLRLVVGMRFAAMEAGGAQFIYLVLFSYAFFFKGFTGLTITVGAILTLFAVMQLTGRIRWAEKFKAGGVS